MENSYLSYGHFVPTPEMVHQLQSFGMSGYHNPWMPNSFYGQQAFPSNGYFQGPPVYPAAATTTNPSLSSMNTHDMNTGKSFSFFF